jgi:hypothetical protein
MLQIFFPLYFASAPLQQLQIPFKHQTLTKRLGFILAREAILIAFSGNWESVRRGVRVDVKYPNGDVVRFFVVSTTQSSDINQRELTITKFLGGVPTGPVAPC